MVGQSPLNAAIAMQRHVAEKMLIGSLSLIAASTEAGRQSVALGSAVSQGNSTSIAVVGEQIMAAGLKPVAKRVRSNAKSPNRKRKGTA